MGEAVRICYTAPMTFRVYLALMAAATALAWAGWFVVLLRLNPDQAGTAGTALFFLTLFFSLVGTFATASMSYRVLKLQRPVISREARIAFRHAILLGFAACLLLFLASQDWLGVWTFLAVFVGFGIVEFCALWVDRSQRA